MRCTYLALLVTLLVAGPIVHAQTTIPASSRVRVSLRDGSKVTGQLVDVRGDTVIVAKRNGLIIAVPGNLTRRVAVSRGKRASAGRVISGALSGAAASLLATAVIPELSTWKCSADVCYTSPEYEKALVIGMVGGGMVGAMFVVDRWETVAGPLRVGFGGDGQHARLGVSFAF